MIPAALGGMEAPVTDVMDVMERIAAVDGSTGWCAAIGAGSNVFAGYMPATGADIVFADPDQCSATMFAPLGRVVNEDGRAVLSGRWPFTSNCLSQCMDRAGRTVPGGGRCRSGAMAAANLHYPDAAPRCSCARHRRGAVDQVSRQARTGRTARRGQLVDAPVSLAELAAQTRGCGQPAPDCAPRSLRRTRTASAASRSAGSFRLASALPACTLATPVWR
jgi:hypothetical protein